MTRPEYFDSLSYGQSGAELIRLASGDPSGRVEKLYEMFARLDRVTSLKAALHEILHSTLALLGADSGYIRLFGASDVEVDVEDGHSFGPIVSHSGFTEAYLDYFSSQQRPVIREARSALYAGRQVLIDDVMTNPAFVAHREVVVAERFHSMQVTPMVDERATRRVGAILTCYEGAYTPPPETLAVMMLYARYAAGSVAHFQEIEYLRRATEELIVLAVDGGASAETIHAQLKRMKERAYLPEPAAEDGLEARSELGIPYGLTMREMEVLINVWQGSSDKEIASRLGISRITTSKHLGSAMRKMNVQTRTQASLRVERETGFKRFASQEPYPREDS